MAIRRKKIRQIAEDLLLEYNIINAPVPVEDIVRDLGIAIRKQDNGNVQISGFLLRRGKHVVIGVNSSQHPVRQRFTIGHELGHYLLHAHGTDEIHIDRSFEIRFRDNLSSEGSDNDEREANLFAAELLMPHHFLEKDLASVSEIDIENDDLMKNLASKYGVSTQALIFRLANLGYVTL